MFPRFRTRRFKQTLVKETSEALAACPEITVRYQWRDKKNLSLRVYPNRLVVVRAPVQLGIEYLRNFVLSHLDWIGKRLVQVQESESRPSRPDEPLFLFGIEQSSDKLQGASMRVWYRRQAENYLPSRCFELRRRLHVAENRPLTVTVRWMRSRWGSCRKDGRITLNAALMICPPRLIDYVIVHELAHLLVPAHNAEFYRLLETWLPQAKAMKKELRLSWSRILFSLTH